MLGVFNGKMGWQGGFEKDEEEVCYLGHLGCCFLDNLARFLGLLLEQVRICFLKALLYKRQTSDEYLSNPP